MKKKVLIVNDERQIGGVAIVLETILNNIDLTNMEIDLLILHDNGERLKKLPIEINVIYGTDFFKTVDIPIKEIMKKFNISQFVNKFKLVYYLKTGLIKNKIIEERKKLLNKDYDIEIAFKDGFTALFTGYGNSKKKIHWLHVDYSNNNPNLKYANLFEDLFSNFDEIIAVSKPVLDEFVKVYNYKGKKTVINNIVDVEDIRSKGEEEVLNIDKDKLSLVSLGRFSFVKGYDNLIEVMSLLKQNNLHNNIILNLYGYGEEEENLKDLVKKLELEDIIKFNGKVSNPYKYVKNSDLFILPSRSESYGLVVIEAMLLGIPVLSVELATVDSLINRDKNGMIVDNSIEGLYNGLKVLIENPKEIEKYKKNLKKYNYENNKIIEEINRLFNS